MMELMLFVSVAVIAYSLLQIWKYKLKSRLCEAERVLTELKGVLYG